MNKRIIGITLFSVIISLSCAAVEVQVPDLESRIRSNGNAVPESALPRLPPSASPMPKEGLGTDSPVSQPVQPEVVKESEVPTDLSSVPDGDGDEKLIHGQARLGAGNPSLVSGSLSLVRLTGGRENAGPALELEFGYESSDGYFGRTPGTGFSDREVLLSLRAFSETRNPGRELAVGLMERNDGFQRLNEHYHSITRRNNTWSLSSGMVGLSKEKIGGGYFFSEVGLKGSSWAVFPESARTTGSPVNPVETWAGYTMNPELGITWQRSGFTASFNGMYSFDGVANAGELHWTENYLSVSWAALGFQLAFEGGLEADSTDGLLTPFSLTFGFQNLQQGLLSASVSGGLRTNRDTPLSLAEDFPFARLSGRPVVGADWYTHAQATCSMLQPWSLSFGLEWNKTAFNRGILGLADSPDSGSMVPVIRFERNSLISTVGVSASHGWFTGSVGYTAQWMDVQRYDTRHGIEVMLECIDTSDRDQAGWELRTVSRFNASEREIPRLSLEALVRPLPLCALVVSIEDPLPPLFDSERIIRDVYRTRCGEIQLSARIDF